MRLHATGTFDSMNPFSSLGTLPEGRDLVADSLMFPDPQDMFTLYPLVAEGYVLNLQESWIEFHVDPQARFHDGSKVTAEDVVFSYQGSMQNLGHGIQQFFKDIIRVEAVDAKRARFYLQQGFDENVLVYLGVLQVQSKRFWERKDIAREYLGKVVGCGPYQLASFVQGKEIVYHRMENYWGRDLPVNRGRYNFAEIRYEYFRDATVAFESFLAGHYDYRRELNQKRWELQYQGRGVSDGDVRQESFQDVLPVGMQGLFFNIRRPLFKKREVREAILLAFDFEWANAVFFNGEQQRRQSFFGNSPYEAPPLPEGVELELLRPFSEHLPSDLFAKKHVWPVSDGKGFNRDNLLRAQELLSRNGFTARDGVLVDPETESSVTFEIVTRDISTKKVLLPFLQNLKRLGITARIRMVDGATYILHLENKDYDLLDTGFGVPRKLGREQWLYWHSANKDLQFGYNRVGAAHPAVDFLVEKIMTEKETSQRIAAARALDRVLRWESYVIPFGIDNAKRVAYWRKFRPPKPLAEMQVLDIHSWWEASEQRP